MSDQGKRPFFAGVVVCDHATEKAIHVKSMKRQMWIPQSAVHDDSEVYKQGHHGKLYVLEWFADQQGWIDGKPKLPLDAPKCRSCGAEIEWRKTDAGKNSPYNADGTPHWATCPQANQHRRARS